ncbi:MAG: DNA repair protein RecN [Deltaproteobacteria bacterium]|nr:DNA repair protein RecN [Deltaproteobacteria bacterium]
MLSNLHIHNFAIIDNLSLSLKNGLNTLSGETGAGKSIIINAINLILGSRSTSDQIRTGSSHASVEAHFVFPDNPELKLLLQEWNIEFSRDLKIKRIILLAGRNKVLINDAPATLQMLGRLAPHMVSVSSQHAHQHLLKPDHTLHLLDEFSGLEKDRNRFSDEYERYQTLKDGIRKSENQIADHRERRELGGFQLQEIERVQPMPGEDELLNEEKVRLQHAEDLLEIARNGYESLYEHNDAILSALSRCGKSVAKGAQLDKRLLPMAEALSEIEINIEDVSFALRDFQETVQIDPKRLAAVADRLDALNSLKRKYGGTIESILRFREKLTSRLDDLAEKKEALGKLVEKRQAMEMDLMDRAEDLSRKRQKGAQGFKTAMERELRQLHMEDTRFEATFEENSPTPGDSEGARIEALGPHGFDHVAFMLSTNPGEAMKPMSTIVSGGELSRIMLAIKTILAKNAFVETIVFDEVDAGISGATAEVVGEKLFSLAAFHQILCITHLPQIACQGENHFLVKKEVTGGRTRARVTNLSPEARVEEIARLLGGRNTTSHAVAHAEAMLGKEAPSS